MKCSVSDVKCSILHAELVEVAHAACVPFNVLFFLMHRSIPNSSIVHGYPPWRDLHPFFLKCAIPHGLDRNTPTMSHKWAKK
jgi:hypothetical protein